MKSFGQRNVALAYKKRKGAYAVIQNTEGQFLCVADQDGHYFLVGGGIEAGETAEAALLRESIEETGYTIRIKSYIGEADRHWVSSKYPTDSQHNHAYLYAGEIVEKIAEPIENEVMCWVDLQTLETHLFHEHHLYLLKQYLQCGS